MVASDHECVCVGGGLVRGSGGGEQGNRIRTASPQLEDRLNKARIMMYCRHVPRHTSASWKSAKPKNIPCEAALSS